MSFIEDLRNKNDKQKRAIAFAIAIFITIIILLIWLSVIFVRFSSGPEIEGSKKPLESLFGPIIDVFKDVQN